MPRVNIATKSSRETKRQYICTACRKTVEPGQRYYYWKQAYAPISYRHTACGRPRNAELSNAKTASLLDAIEDAQVAISRWEPTLERDGDGWEDVNAEDLFGILDEVASEADSIADEYEGNADNMPESLQYGSQAEAMRDVAERLREWADNVRNFDGSAQPDLPDNEDEAEEALISWIENQRSEAEALLEDMPEYEY